MEADRTAALASDGVIEKVPLTIDNLKWVRRRSPQSHFSLCSCRFHFFNG
ncbi:hypothetical protein RISK_006281 [Rhodopirellula islandica]|uniref:Uncharacterized protein n=1 Tax=Rhodopirellula islandica TaxID=595434 RepID=A0A0J1B4X6_RHOIS|nr:hypothetical protein RISK_006281 [Rhodopirellula islandica]